MPLSSTSAVTDWLTTSPGVFVLVAALALLLSVAGPLVARGIETAEAALRTRWGRPRDSSSVPVARRIRLVPVDDTRRRVPPADVEA